MSRPQLLELLGAACDHYGAGTILEGDHGARYVFYREPFGMWAINRVPAEAIDDDWPLVPLRRYLLVRLGGEHSIGAQELARPWAVVRSGRRRPLRIGTLISNLRDMRFQRRIGATQVSDGELRELVADLYHPDSRDLLP